MWRRLTTEKEEGRAVFNPISPPRCFGGVEAERTVYCGEARGKKGITTGTQGSLPSAYVHLEQAGT